MQKFYDTNALLALQEDAFTEKFYISTETLRELENIKTSRHKDENLKYDARHLSKLLMANPDKYEAVYLTVDGYDELCRRFGDHASPDDLIVFTANSISKKIPDLEFVTEDICCYNLARLYEDLRVTTLPPPEKDYTGYREVRMNDGDMAYFYEHMDQNVYELLVNQYLIVKDMDGQIVDKYCWTGETHRPVSFKSVKSNYFGTLKPYQGDIYQQLVLDSLTNNQLTMIKGPAGTGKSYLALSYLFYLMEKHKIDKIIVFANPVATVNSAKQGFYPGSRDEKLRDSVVGNMLAAKVGGTFALEDLMARERIVLLPMSDIRGYDTTGMKAGVYITEAQNLDITLMKLALQRIGEDSLCIIDGDYNTQVDLSAYAGRNNGMRRMSEVFRGDKLYGEIELQNIYRSRIANIAEQM